MDYEAVDVYPLPVEQYLAGDCAWLSICNGKENMSNHWCIYCPLSRSQFLVISGNHPIVNWTIALLTEMANDATKKGPARLGVTGRWPSIFSMDSHSESHPSGSAFASWNWE